jgi:hypothetical protein
MMKTNIQNQRSEIRHRRSTFGVAVLLLAMAVSAGHGQNFTLDWSKVDGGGGTSTGGVYSVAGTIGQSDSGHMSGGNFTLQGGFWSVIASIQTPGAPLLSVTCLGSTLVVSWPLPATGWVLEQASVLTGAVIPWSQVPTNQYLTDATHCTINVPSPAGTKFYRLRKP